MLTSFWKLHVRLGSLIPFPLYFLFCFEIELFCQSLDGGICVLSRDTSAFVYCSKAWLLWVWQGP